MGAGYGVHADHAARAATILHHDGLAQFCRQLLGERAGGVVDDAAGAVGHHDGHGLALGVGLGVCGARERAGRAERA
ncbi:hypothetical protein D9M69_590740 [compost metagenome]